MIELIAKVIFGVNATMLLVLAAVYFVAGFRQQERYWTSWWLSSLILGIGLASFIVQDLLPRSVGVLLPNLMLISDLVCAGGRRGNSPAAPSPISS